MLDERAKHFCVGVVFRCNSGKRVACIAWITSCVIDEEKTCADLPGGVQTIANRTHNVVQLTGCVGPVPVGCCEPLREHEVPVPTLAQQIGLLDDGAVTTG